MDSYLTYSIFFSALRRQLNEIYPNAVYQQTPLTLAYLFGQMNHIKANGDYIPVQELDFIKHMIDTIDPEALQHRYYTRLLKFLNGEELSNILLDFKKELLQISVQQFIEDANEGLENILDTLRHNHFMTEYREAELKGPPVTGAFLRNAESQKKATLNFLKNTLSWPPVTETSEVSQALPLQDDLHLMLSSDQIKELVALRTQPIMTPSVYDFIVHYFLQHSQDKRLFMQDYLKAYRAFYNACEFSKERDILLSGLPPLLLLFNNYLAPEELLEDLLQSISFELQGRTVAYTHYELFLSLVYGKPLEGFEKLFSLANIDTLLGYASILGKRLLPDSRLVKDQKLLYLPPTLLLKFLGFETKTQADFIMFLEKYEQIDRTAKLFQRRPIVGFLAINEEKIIQLIAIMGDKGIAYMRKQLAGTTLTLERKLENLPLLEQTLRDECSVYYKNMEPVGKEPDDAFYSCLILSGVLTSHASTLTTVASKEAKYEADGSRANQQTGDTHFAATANVTMAMILNSSPHILLIKLALLIIRKILPDITLALTDQEVNDMFTRIPPGRLTNLIQAFNTMSTDQYKPVFIELLKFDLLGGNVDDFLHNVQQGSLIGSEISKHNEEIHKLLESHNILPREALRYPKTSQFVIINSLESKDSTLRPEDNAKLVLWDYLLRLGEETKNTLVIASSSPFQAQLNSIQKCIETIKGDIGDSKHSLHLVKAFSKGTNQNLVKKILRNTQALKFKGAPLLASFFEFSDHLSSQFDLINQEEKSPDQEKYYIKVEQWPKERVDTFFLGDYVGCCLASDGAQFSAMVQRRFDDALLFHVAVDQITKKPAALAWLYLATTADDKVILMANFFEVNAKYAAHPPLRKALLNSLLIFTQQYLKDTKIQDFYMNHLTYGWNINDLEKYPMEIVDIMDKVGGAYTPSTTQETLPTQEVYYLSSLSEDSFHHFIPEILTVDSSPNMFSLKDIVQRSMLDMGNKRPELQEFILKTYNTHRITLEHFYEQPVLTNDQFLTDMKVWYMYASYCSSPKSLLTQQTLFHRAGGSVVEPSKATTEAKEASPKV